MKRQRGLENFLTESKPKASIPKDEATKQETSRIVSNEVPSIRLSPEQIEEIHVDEYSLTLFYATRVQPLTLNEIKRQFAEPEPKKAQAVLDRFLRVGLVHLTAEGCYYSNFPDNYINYSHYRYDGDLEARKDAKVFELMKEFTGKTEFWKDKTYFSMDAFYSQEQSEELLEMFKAIRLKAKEFANENSKKKSIQGLRFRRMKFYDMTFAILLALSITLDFSPKASAGGNDPIINLFSQNPSEAWRYLKAARFSGGGNDPTTKMHFVNQKTADSSVRSLSEGGGGHDPNGGPTPNGGGGHDPGNSPKPQVACYLEISGYLLALSSKTSCKLKLLADYLSNCETSLNSGCLEASRQVDEIVQHLQLNRGEP